MYRYYKKNSLKLKKNMNKYLILIRNEIEHEFKKPYEEIFEEVWIFYYANIMENSLI